jgi:DNA mismatch repair ATPase MutS
MESLKLLYQQKIDDYSLQLQDIQKRVNFVSILRLACFAVLALSIYYCVKDFHYTYLIGTLLLVVAFIVLVRIYFNLKDKKTLISKLLFINKNESGIINGEPNQFDNGKDFESHENYYDDLDIFGRNSLYHVLNRTTTTHGSAQLSNLLKKPILEKEKILNQQDAIKILAIEADKRQLLIAHGLLHQEKQGNLYSILDWLKIPSRINKNKFLLIIRWALPLYNIAALLYYLQTDNYFALAIGVIASWLTIGSFAKHINHQHLLIGEKQKILNQYADILKIFGTINPQQSILLKELRNDSAHAHQIINQLSQLSSWFDQRLNMVVNILLNSFLVYDIQCIIALENWKEKNSKDFEKYIDCVGNIECLNSLSCFAHNHQRYSYPVILQKEFSIEATQIAHPLIPENENVANDFSIGKENKLHLLTGSNMSGKTTFLRSIGVNLLLAESGAPVFAKAFSFVPMNILSSIRVSDSLQDHTSYFMAELKRLQQIIHQLQNGEPALVLVDEILRGTNSEDKTFGSEEFVKKLLQYNCLSLFATHDLALSKLENEFPDKVSNYCFESIIQNGELLFDYKLQTGVAKNRNASFLMKKMQII